jgi:predicted dienelactone hydrolase/ABC-type amino acid transport substrate-binding protein
VRLNSGLIINLAQQLIVYFNYRDAAVTAIDQQMAAEATTQSEVKVNDLADLTKPGSFKVEKRSFTFNRPRSRQTANGEYIADSVEVDLYLPKNKFDPSPVIVISHGLGAYRERLAWLAEHLASYGFAAVTPGHAGSDLARRQAVLQGTIRSDINPVAYVDRPRDIQFTLDQLEKLNQTDPTLKGQLNLEQVGITGNSLGGQTALAVAGAEINAERLHQTCQDSAPTLNTSLFAQCLANRLPALDYSPRDPRIKAALALHPATSAVFGPESLAKIQIPVLIVAGSNDIMAPATAEQIYAFTALKTEQKYLAMLVPSGHIFEDAEDNLPPSLGRLLGGPEPELKKNMVKVLSVAFMRVHLEKESSFGSYLTPAYAEFLKGQELRMSLVRSLTEAQIEQAFGGAPPLPVIPPLVALTAPDQAKGTLATIRRTGVLRAGVAVGSAQPFGFQEGNQFKGYCVDLVTALAKDLSDRLQTPVVLQLTPIANPTDRLSAVQTKRLQVECGPNSTQSSLNGIAFSNPFFATGTQVLTPADRAPQLTFTPPATVQIGVEPQNITPDLLQRIRAESLVPFPGANGLTDGIQSVVAGKTNAFAGDGILLIQAMMAQDIPHPAYPLVPKTPLTCKTYGLALPAGDAQWQGTVNRFLDGAPAKEIWKTWFKTYYPYTYYTLDNCADRAIANPGMPAGSPPAP